MSEIDEKITHLENLLKTIKDAKASEESFDKLYRTLKEEYSLENPNNIETEWGTYAWYLENTLADEANWYRECRYDRSISKKNKLSIYDDFVKSFESDVDKRLRWLKNVPEPPTQ